MSSGYYKVATYKNNVSLSYILAFSVTKDQKKTMPTIQCLFLTEFVLSLYYF